MSSTQISSERGTQMPSAATVDLKLEVVVIPVSNIDRASRFYQGLGWRLDADLGAGENRVVQLTPPGSPCSIHLRQANSGRVPGSVQGTFLVVDDMQAARAELVGRGAKVSDVFHTGTTGPAPGPDPEGHSYTTFASFSDPDGNGWLLQEIKSRLPGRGFSSLDLATLIELLREAENHHGAYEPTAPKHHWSEFYGAYIVAREQGKTPEQAAEEGALNVERTRERVRT
jgi:catechol 2,3-dioxygenase-like lactoylglutathione lyase family enzyme